jgi:hypothetical protein
VKTARQPRPASHHPRCAPTHSAGCTPVLTRLGPSLGARLWRALVIHRIHAYHRRMWSGDTAAGMESVSMAKSAQLSATVAAEEDAGLRLPAIAQPGHQHAFQAAHIYQGPSLSEWQRVSPVRGRFEVPQFDTPRPARPTRRVWGGDPYSPRLAAASGLAQRSPPRGSRPSRQPKSHSYRRPGA